GGGRSLRPDREQLVLLGIRLDPDVLVLLVVRLRVRLQADGTLLAAAGLLVVGGLLAVDRDEDLARRTEREDLHLMPDVLDGVVRGADSPGELAGTAVVPERAARGDDVDAAAVAG